MIKYLLITLGFISLTLGLLGIVTPGLPTTPFILLTAYLFTRSSPKLHKKLKDNRVTGYYLNKMEGGLSFRARLISISIMWCMVLFTAFIVFDGKMRYIMLCLGIIGTAAQLIVLSRKKRMKSVEVIIPESNISKEIENDSRAT